MTAPEYDFSDFLYPF